MATGYGGRRWHRGYCDHGHGPVQVTRLELGGNAGIFVCKQHYQSELQYRQDRGWYKGKKPNLARVWPEYNTVPLKKVEW